MYTIINNKLLPYDKQIYDEMCIFADYDMLVRTLYLLSMDELLNDEHLYQVEPMSDKPIDGKPDLWFLSTRASLSLKFMKQDVQMIAPPTRPTNG